VRSVPIRRPGHATVVAYLALFVALAGTAVAAKKIQSSDIAKNAVKTKKIADAAVTNPKIANFAVNNSKLADEAVTEAKLAPDSVSGNKIQQASIGTGKLRQGAVETDKIADGAVTGPKLADGAVTGPKVADASLGLADVAQVVARVNLPTDGSIAQNTCEHATVAAPGLQNGDDVLVLPGTITGGWPSQLMLGAYAPQGSTAVVAEVCNTVVSSSVPATVPITVLGFR
jgi:hypothetical protein